MMKMTTRRRSLNNVAQKERNKEGKEQIDDDYESEGTLKEGELIG